MIPEELLPELLLLLLDSLLPEDVVEPLPALGRRPELLDELLLDDLAGHGGRIVFVGLFQGEAEFNDPNFHKRELTLMASRNAIPAEFTQVINAMESGLINTDPWITHRLDLADVPGLFASVINDPSLRKAVIHLDD